MRCFLDIAVDGEEYGRVVIKLFDPSTIAAQRFRDLCKGIEGVGYRRSKFDGIFEVCGFHTSNALQRMSVCTSTGMKPAHVF